MTPAEKLRLRAVAIMEAMGYHPDVANPAVSEELAPRLAEAARCAVARAERELADETAAARRAEPRTFVFDYRRSVMGWEGDLQYQAPAFNGHLLARLAEQCDNLTIRVVGCRATDTAEKFREACRQIGVTLVLD